MGPAVPKDRHGLVRHLFLFIAFVPLLSVHFFLVMTAYWMSKFRDPLSPDTRTDLQIHFTTYLSAAFTPSVVVPLLNALVGHRYRTTPRLITAICLLILLISLHLALATLNTSAWQLPFLAITLVTFFLITASIGVFMSGFTGLVGCFPPEYMIAVLRGQSLCGVFCATTNIIVLLLGCDATLVALFCFSLTILLHIGALLAFIYTTSTRFFQHHVTSPPPSACESTPLLAPASPFPSSLRHLAWTIRLELATILLTSLVTMAGFPGLTVLVESVHLHTDAATAWERTYFVPVSCFLTFYLGDFTGRLVMPHLPSISSTTALAAAMVRLLALPTILLCNLVPNHRVITSVLIHSDLAYIFIMLIFSLSTGFLTCVVMVAARGRVGGRDRQIVTNMMLGGRSLGMVLGSGLGLLLVNLL